MLYSIEQDIRTPANLVKATPFPTALSGRPAVLLNSTKGGVVYARQERREGWRQAQQQAQSQSPEHYRQPVRDRAGQ